jgi:hypothetical protein
MSAEARGLQRDNEVAAFLQIGFGGVSGECAREDLLDASTAAATRCALAAGFVGAEGEDMLDQLGNVGVLVERHDAAVPDARANGRELFEAERRVEQMRRNHADDGPADDDTHQLPAAAQSAADLIDDVPDGDAELDFVQAGTIEQRVERQRLGSAALGEAHRRIGFAAVRDDPRHVDERLDIVEQRRPVE